MKQQGVVGAGIAAFALLCAFAVWWIGPVSRYAPAAEPAASAPAVLERSAEPSAPSVPAAAKPAPEQAPKAEPTKAPPLTPTASPAPVVAASSPTPAPTVAAVTARQLEADIAKQLQGKIIEFESKSDALTPRGKEVLDGLLPLFAKDPSTRFVIEGHTDSWGEPAYNQALSERRARSVQAYLVSKGLDAKRFDAKGVGDARPIADNKTSAGSRKNRRIEFKAL
jgi:outer membrane protein OmpA-like peptidoglycan-associated protein